MLRRAFLSAILSTVTLLAGLKLPQVRFDYNLLNLQSAGLPAVVYEHKLIQNAGRSAKAARTRCWLVQPGKYSSTRKRLTCP